LKLGDKANLDNAISAGMNYGLISTQQF
jgi:hypothetical protein